MTAAFEKKETNEWGLQGLWRQFNCGYREFPTNDRYLATTQDG